MSITRHDAKLGKKQTGLLTDSDALAYVIRHFASSNLGTKVPVEDILFQLEQFYNVRIEVVK